MRVSRRLFLVGSLAIATAATALLRRYAAVLEGGRTEETVRTICDRILPGHDDVPGAVALGVDRDVLEELRATRRGRLRLLLLVGALEREEFLAATPATQLEIVSELLAVAQRDADAPVAGLVATIYDECTQRYFTNAAAWRAIGYRVPQPHGYPDYTECVRG